MARLAREFDVEIVFRHFPLHPDTPRRGLTLEELFVGRDIDVPASQQRIARLIAEEGLPYGTRTRTFNSRLAQELAVWAAEQPGGTAVHDLLFQAYFVEGRNLSELDVLVEIVAQLGLSTEEARRVLVEGDHRDRVDLDWRRSRELGITGVPTFVVGNKGLVGAQGYEQLEMLLVDAGAERRPA